MIQSLRTPAAVLLFALSLALLPTGELRAAPLTLPESGDVPGWEPSGKVRRFTAADLYGHINGGAELFLEIGFEELLVQSYACGEREIALEVYRMKNPPAALAIYLFKCGEETPWPEIEARNSSNRFQAVLVRGDCFVLVNSFSGDESLRPEMAALAGRLLESLPAAVFGDPFAVLPVERRVAGSLRLIRGEYSLQSLYTLGPGDVLQLGGEIFGVAADYSVPGGKTIETLIHVDYPDAARADRAFAHLRCVLDPTIKPLEQDTQRLLFRDFAGRYGLAVLDKAAIEIRVNLSCAPDKAADTPVEP